MAIKNWSELGYLFDSELWQNINKFVKSERSYKTIFPQKDQVFSAFEKCSFAKTKVIILGQDPYHGKNQANGLSFAVNNGVKIPPSLRNIFTEINTDIGKIPENSDLIFLAKQGVLLLNSILTVELNNPNSHSKCGWEDFTDEVISFLSEKKKNVVFILWGGNAQKKQELIDKNKHLILIAPHPSPLSSYRGFFGCKHFSKANEYLISQNLTPINWV